MIPAFILSLILLFGGVLLAFILIPSLISGEYRHKTFLPIVGVYLSIGGWVIAFEQIDPQFVMTTEETSLNETIKEGRKVQWFYNSFGKYEEINGVYERPDQKKIVLLKYVEQPRLWLEPDNNVFAYEIQDIGENK